MTTIGGSDSPLEPGLYDHLVNLAIRARTSTPDAGIVAQLTSLDSEDSHAAVAQYLERLVFESLSTLRGRERADRQRRLVEKVLATLSSEMGETWSDGLRLTDPLQRLLAVHASEAARHSPRPDTPLSRSALLTGTRIDPSLASQLSKEFASADRVDILCSFIRWSGLRLLMDSLQELTATAHPAGPRLRVISTSYMGATDPRAIEALRDLPHTEVRVSYDTARTRLHAKAFLVHRATGFGSAYVGSANVSQPALSEGLEWTSKISQYELPHLWHKLTATFDSYWEDDEFERFGPGSSGKLAAAIERERRSGSAEPGDPPQFDLRPYPFQEEILDALAAERDIHDKHRHLVIAATGTGKTKLAAFDYKRWSGGSRPSLLFIAHREEILRQALGTFRAVLRDHNFGDLLVGGSGSDHGKHLFCSIQSYNSRDLHRSPPDAFDYVVVDEFHHAAAPSYRRLLEAVRPRVLLGLTATPERTDGLDVLAAFGGEPSAEVRLPDAIARRLLCPFQYFGVADAVDLDGFRWQRGGYRTEDLNAAYTGNDVRAALVLGKVYELLLDPRRARGLGFCASVEHARYMAKYFTDRGVPALALSAESPHDDRASAQRRLVAREINFLFVVDLYNEGVDIPEVDTVLFLRPTESLTVYLQQLGRGLRLHQDKDCLTVLDFIGAQHQQFRFGSRLRALSTAPQERLTSEIEAGFPHLPPGCSIRLERVAQARVLANVRQSVLLHRARLATELQALRGYLGKVPSIHEAISHLEIGLGALLQKGPIGPLLGHEPDSGAGYDQDAEILARGISRMAHLGDPAHLGCALQHLEGAVHGDPLAEQRLAMLYVTLWGKQGASMTLAQAAARLRDNPGALRDLREVLGYQLQHTHIRTCLPLAQFPCALSLHAEYSRDEALVALGYWTMDRRPDFREGVLHLAERRLDAFFVTLQKTEDAYSPTTMYEDYPIGDSLFHWQSQSTTSAESPTGRRYIRHRDLGYTPVLFVRQRRETDSGGTSPYVFLGPLDYVSHEGSRPMSIRWRLRTPMPIRVARATTA